MLWNRNTVTKTSCFPEINSVSHNSANRGGTDHFSEADFPLLHHYSHWLQCKSSETPSGSSFCFNLSLWQISPTREAVTDRVEFCTSVTWTWLTQHSGQSPPSLDSYRDVTLTVTTDERIGQPNLLNINLIRYTFFFCLGEDFVWLVSFRGRVFC